jgi:hypothetical protein
VNIDKVLVWKNEMYHLKAAAVNAVARQYTGGRMWKLLKMIEVCYVQMP